ncbi:MAG: hypothetical protein IT485_09275, partial [Gammaproteobacteria bacterium]|nr:hypothetical protein [Gammaproteobacteria bacterium]
MSADAEREADSTLAGASLGLRQRSTLLDLDRQLHAHWNLGRNLILAWCPYESGMLALVVPHYAVAEYASAGGGAAAAEDARQDFVLRLLSGPRRFDLRQISNAARLLHAEPVYLALRQPLAGSDGETQLIDHMVRRYGVSFVPSRAVALFDIVGFSLLRPFEQMTQLNSLAHSLNSAHSKMIGSR